MSPTSAAARGALQPTSPAAVNAGSIPLATAQTPTQAPEISPKPVGYGLPCAKCRTYYAADLHACPVCRTPERVSPTAAPVRATIAASEPLADPVALEAEREKFLQEFQAQVLASQGAANPLAAQCARGENHPESPEPATVCQGCYDQLQERVDVLEAALHMDVKEAAQIVYDAVWANPADPNLTYQNAAVALLSELRKRSGVTPTFRPLQPMMD
jgi:hypothetical protein